MSKTKFVDHLNDLISPEDYAGDPAGRIVRIEIRVSENGIEILGDSQRVRELEMLLKALEPVEIEQMLCG